MFIAVAMNMMACSTMGPKFMAANTPPTGQALVYFFRDKVHYGGGYATAYYINDVSIVKLRDKGYSWAYLDEGDYTFRADGQVLALSVVAGQSYYLGYHQSTGDFGSHLTAKNYYQEYPYADIKDRLISYRYKKAKPTPAGFDDVAQKAVNREYIHYSGGTPAVIRVQRSAALQELYADASMYLYGNAIQCKSGKHVLLNDLLAGGPLTVQAEAPITLSATSLSRNNGIYRSCQHRITFTPITGRSYTIELDAVSQFFQGKRDQCIAQVIDDDSGQVIEFMERKNQIKLIDSSPECSKREFDKAEFITQSNKPNDCFLIQLGNRQRCFF